MKTNKLPKSAWPDAQAAGSQSQQTKSSQHYLDKNYLKKGYRKTDNTSQSSDASNDASYHNDSANDMPVGDVTLKASATDNEFVYKKSGQNAPKAAKSVLIDSSNHDQNNHNTSFKSTQDLQSNSFQNGGGYKKAPAYKKVQKTTGINTTDIDNDAAVGSSAKSLNGNTKSNKCITAEAGDTDDGNQDMGVPTIAERIFMNGLIKHTGIAVAIIIPVA